MRSCILNFLFVFILSNAFILSGTSACPNGFIYYQHSCYKIGTEEISYQSALEFCTSNGGILSEIRYLHFHEVIVAVAPRAVLSGESPSFWISEDTNEDSYSDTTTWSGWLGQGDGCPMFWIPNTADISSGRAGVADCDSKLFPICEAPTSEIWEEKILDSKNFGNRRLTAPTSETFEGKKMESKNFGNPRITADLEASTSTGSTPESTFLEKLQKLLDLAEGLNKPATEIDHHDSGTILGSNTIQDDQEVLAAFFPNPSSKPKSSLRNPFQGQGDKDSSFRSSELEGAISQLFPNYKSKIPMSAFSELADPEVPVGAAYLYNPNPKARIGSSTVGSQESPANQQINIQDPRSLKDPVPEIIHRDIFQDEKVRSTISARPLKEEFAAAALSATGSRPVKFSPARTTAQDMDSCEDHPGWKDALGYTCLDYAVDSFCTLDRGYGAGWNSGWGTFDLYAVHGLDATEACCTCGSWDDSLKQAAIAFQRMMMHNSRTPKDTADESLFMELEARHGYTVANEIAPQVKQQLMLLGLSDTETQQISDQIAAAVATKGGGAEGPIMLHFEQVEAAEAPHELKFSDPFSLEIDVNRLLFMSNSPVGQTNGLTLAESPSQLGLAMIPPELLYRLGFPLYDFNVTFDLTLSSIEEGCDGGGFLFSFAADSECTEQCSSGSFAVVAHKNWNLKPGIFFILGNGVVLPVSKYTPESFFSRTTRVTFEYKHVSDTNLVSLAVYTNGKKQFRHQALTPKGMTAFNQTFGQMEFAAVVGECKQMFQISRLFLSTNKDLNPSDLSMIDLFLAKEDVFDEEPVGGFLKAPSRMDKPSDLFMLQTLMMLRPPGDVISPVSMLTQLDAQGSPMEVSSASEGVTLQIAQILKFLDLSFEQSMEIAEQVDEKLDALDLSRSDVKQMARQVETAFNGEVQQVEAEMGNLSGALGVSADGLERLSDTVGLKVQGVGQLIDKQAEAIDYAVRMDSSNVQQDVKAKLLALQAEYTIQVNNIKAILQEEAELRKQDEGAYAEVIEAHKAEMQWTPEQDPFEDQQSELEKSLNELGQTLIQEIDRRENNLDDSPESQDGTQASLQKQLLDLRSALLEEIRRREESSDEQDDEQPSEDLEEEEQTVPLDSNVEEEADEGSLQYEVQQLKKELAFQKQILQERSIQLAKIAAHASEEKCEDSPSDWADSYGLTCENYVTNNLCTSDGKYGEAWEIDWGTFKDYSADGVDAAEACCSCGGGRGGKQLQKDDLIALKNELEQRIKEQEDAAPPAPEPEPEPEPVVITHVRVPKAPATSTGPRVPKVGSLANLMKLTSSKEDAATAPPQTGPWWMSLKYEAVNEEEEEVEEQEPEIIEEIIAPAVIAAPWTANYGGIMDAVKMQQSAAVGIELNNLQVKSAAHIDEDAPSRLILASRALQFGQTVLPAQVPLFLGFPVDHVALTFDLSVSELQKGCAGGGFLFNYARSGHCDASQCEGSLTGGTFAVISHQLWNLHTGVSFLVDGVAIPITTISVSDFFNQTTTLTFEFKQEKTTSRNLRSVHLYLNGVEKFMHRFYLSNAQLDNPFCEMEFVAANSACDQEYAISNLFFSTEKELTEDDLSIIDSFLAKEGGPSAGNNEQATLLNFMQHSFGQPNFQTSTYSTGLLLVGGLSGLVFLMSWKLYSRSTTAAYDYMEV